jgi:hypothetical protein
VKAWGAIGIPWLTPEYLEEHWQKIKRWKNAEPRFAAGARRKEVATHATGKRTVIFLTPDEPEMQINPKTPALPEKVEHMKKSEAFPSKYLKSSDLNGEDLTATISSLEWEEVGQEKTSKPVLYFRGKVKPLILNGTNWDSIVEVTGEDDSDEWDGKKITMYVDEVPFGSKMVDAIRIRRPKTSKGKAKAEPQPPVDDDVPF